MKLTVEINISTNVNHEVRRASVDMEVPEGATWEAAAELAAAFVVAYARLWEVPSNTVYANVAVLRSDRMVVGDVPARLLAKE